MPVSTHRGQVKGGVLQEWRVGSINLKEDRVLIKTLGMINVQKKAFATLMKADEIKVRTAEKRMMTKAKGMKSYLTQMQYEWAAGLEEAGKLEKLIAILPPVNTQRIKDAARLNKLMTKDELERQLSAQGLTIKQRQLDALKERYAGLLESASQTEIASIDCHKAFKVAIAERQERYRRMMLGLPLVTEQDKQKEGGGHGSQEDRMNELAAEKRSRRLKQAKST